MNDLSGLEAVVDALPTEEKRELVQFLLARLRSEGVETSDLSSPGHSVLDIKPVSLGRVLLPLSSDDDILGEMTENCR